MHRRPIHDAFPNATLRPRLTECGGVACDHVRLDPLTDADYLALADALRVRHEAERRAGWRIEQWDGGAWVPVFSPFGSLYLALRIVRSGERIVNVGTGRVVLEA